MNWPNQSQASLSLFAPPSLLKIVIPLIPLTLSIWLTSTSDLAQAKFVPSGILVAQTVFDRLPPPPPSSSEKFSQPPKSQTALPSTNFAQEQVPSSFSPREFDFQPPPSQTNSTQENYLIYVNSDSSTDLQRVQQIEPTAFVRQYKGRSVIQAGVFEQEYNAALRLKELQSKGIRARLVSLATGEETDVVENSKYYFVVIPAARDDLPTIAAQVRKLRTDTSVNVSERRRPRGSHVRVGPFSERGQAESWNHYLLDFGLRNARVYHGR